MNLNKLLLGMCMIIILSMPILAIPQTLNIQGRLTNNQNISLVGTYNMTFSIYNVSTSGSSLYTYGPINVTTDNRGIYSVIIPYITLNFSEQYYLGITVANDSEMSPRLNLTSNPYAFRAKIAEELDSLGNYSVSGLLVDIDTLFVDASNNRVGIGTLIPQSKLEVNGTIISSGLTISAGTVALPTGAIDTNEILDSSILEIDLNASNSPSNGNILAYNSTNGGFYWTTDQNSGGTVTTAATTNYIPYMSSSTNVANSAIYQNSGNIGVGTVTPQAKLDVNGSIRLSGSSGTTCDVDHRGELRYATDYSGTEDAILSCMKNSTGAYNWVLIARGG